MFNIKEKSIHEVFLGSLILKGIGSTLEILGGLLFLFTGKIVDLLDTISQNELLEDSNDFVGNQIQHWLPYFSNVHEFGAIYLLSHGIVKTFIVVSLLRNKTWAYPVSIVVLLLFIAYQLYRLMFGFSIFLVGLTIFDIFLIILTWHEYNRIRKHLSLE
jgi:uncharacterized membrane protein